MGHRQRFVLPAGYALRPGEAGDHMGPAGRVNASAGHKERVRGVRFAFLPEKRSVKKTIPERQKAQTILIVHPWKNI